MLELTYQLSHFFPKIFDENLKPIEPSKNLRIVRCKFYFVNFKVKIVFCQLYKSTKITSSTIFMIDILVPLKQGLNNKIKVTLLRCYGLGKAGHWLGPLYLDLNGYELGAISLIFPRDR